MVVSSPADFARAVAAYRFDRVELEPEAVAAARATLGETGLLLVGEPHGVRETPAVAYRLASLLGTRALALEWSHEELDERVQAALRTGRFAFEDVWTLPPSAEFFCGDGRITAGHFALLERLRGEARLEQVILFDRLDRDPADGDGQVREGELAARLLAEWNRRLPLLVLTGAFHARLDVPEGATMARRLARRLPKLRPAMLHYAHGRCWFHGVRHLVGEMPDAPIRLRVPAATPADVPGTSP